MICAIRTFSHFLGHPSKLRSFSVATIPASFRTVPLPISRTICLLLQDFALTTQFPSRPILILGDIRGS
jgi:hypothetical protein